MVSGTFSSWQTFPQHRHQLRVLALFAVDRSPAST
jgi:hypothetical protein